MTKTYLLDTCIWRDFYENRFSKTGRPLGKYATDLFMKILKNKDKILFSIYLILELKKDHKEEEINDMLNFLFLNKTLIKIDITKKEYEEAKQISKQRNIPLVDCLNAIQARNYNAILVSQDKHFFENISDITKPVRPQNI